MEQPDSTSDVNFAQAGGSGSTIPEEFFSTLVIPDHELLREIGKGSYGAVWLARNSLGQYRAVKIVLRQSFKDQRPFEREWSGIQRFEPISRSHEGFVDILHVGIKKGDYFYYIMELGDDEASGQRIIPDNYSPKTLGKEITRHGKRSFDECLQLGIALSQALSELHKHDLVHRDVKPSNIIYVNGIPKLADIGLVADLKEARSYVGTEGFIPPEGPGSARADVYGLGKVLYEAATGKDRQEFPELPTLLDEFQDLEKILELNEIILKACKCNPDERYHSAWEMYSELLVLANGNSVKRLRFLENRFAAYKRLARVMALLAFLGAFPCYILWREYRIATDARERQIGVNVANGIQRMNADDNLASLPFFAQAIALDPAPARSWENRFRFSAAWSVSPKIIQFWRDPAEMNMAVFGPDDQQVLQIENFGKARVFDVKTGVPVSPPFGRGQGLSFGAFSPDGKFIVTADQESRTADVWDTQTWTAVLSLRHATNISCACFSPDGRRIATSCADNIVRVWNAGTGALELELKGHAKPAPRDIIYVAFSHDQRRVVTTEGDALRIWDSTTGQELEAPLMHPKWVVCAAFSPDDQFIATACLDYKARIWEVSSGKMIPPEMRHAAGVYSVQFSPDGQLLLTGCLDRTARLWFSADHSPMDGAPILSHSDRVTSAFFASNGHQIVTACIDGTVRVWDLAPGAVMPERLRGSFSRNGERFVSLETNRFQIIDTVTTNPVSGWMTPPFPVRAVTLDPQGRFALAISTASASNPATELAQVFDAAKGQALFPPLSIGVIFTNLSLSQDGKKLLGAGSTNVQVWDMAGGLPLWPPISTDQIIVSATSDAAFRKIIICHTNRAEVYDAMTGKLAFAPFRNKEWLAQIGSAEFSPDGSRIAICWKDPFFTKYSALICSAETGAQICPPLKHGDGVLSVAFSPDGRRVVTASEDATAMIWDAATGAALTPPLKHANQVTSASFNADGRVVITISRDGNVRLWSAHTGEPLTPPLKHLATPRHVNLLQDGRHLLTRSSPEEAWLSQFPDAGQPVQDLKGLAYLLTSESALVDLKPGANQSTPFGPIWDGLRNKYPSDFVTTPAEVIRWHEMELEIANAMQQSNAAEFHLQRLPALR